MPEEEKAPEGRDEEPKPEESMPGEGGAEPEESEAEGEQAPESKPEEPKPEESAGAGAAPVPSAEAEDEAAWPPAGEVTKDEKTMAMLVWLLAIFTWFIGPLVIYLVKKDESKFVAFHGLQALWFGVVVLGAVIILAGVTCFFGGVGGAPVGLLALVVDIIWLIKANNGEWAELPVVGKWARKGL